MPSSSRDVRQKMNIALANQRCNIHWKEKEQMSRWKKETTIGFGGYKHSNPANYWLHFFVILLHWNAQRLVKRDKKIWGPDRGSNPEPRAPEARIIPLDHQADVFFVLVIVIQAVRRSRFNFYFEISLSCVSACARTIDCFVENSEREREKEMKFHTNSSVSQHTWTC